MYLPENHDQMYDILSALRVYAASNALDGLAERLDDAMVTLMTEIGREQNSHPAPLPRNQP